MFDSLLSVYSLYTFQVFFGRFITRGGWGSPGLVWKGAGPSGFVSSVYFVLWSFPSVSSVSLPFLLFCFLCSSSSPCQPQLGNLLQVNRTLGRNVPLASQLILMPNGAVAAVQQEAPSAQSPGVHTDADQVSGDHLTCGRALGRANGVALDQGSPFHPITTFQNSSPTPPSISVELESLTPF